MIEEPAKEFYIRHVSNKKAYIQTAVFPPRLCEWTLNLDEAQAFEIEREANQTAEYITAWAFNVEVFRVVHQS
jgi:hypothetical protein